MAGPGIAATPVMVCARTHFGLANETGLGGVRQRTDSAVLRI